MIASIKRPTYFSNSPRINPIDKNLFRKSFETVTIVKRIQKLIKKDLMNLEEEFAIFLNFVK
jgi:hypothetical protein